MKRKLLSLILVLTMLTSIALFVGCGSKTAETSGQNVNKEVSTLQLEATTEAEKTTAAPKFTEINLMMIGDMLIHEGVYKSALQADGSYNFDHLFKNVLGDVSAADISIVNQETILGGVELGLSGYPCFNSPYELGDAIAKAGFNVVLQATNHTIDKGLTGVENCLNYWATKHPLITVLGINETQEHYNDIYVYQKNGFKIAILNYTYGTNGIALPASKPYIVNLLDKDKITADVTKAKTMADLVVVCPHWGTEYVYTPDSNQKYWTQLFSSLGVDLVIGSHPHVIEPVETIERSDGHKMVVFYSLGNFVSNQDASPRMLGGMAKVTFRKDDTGAYIKDYSIVPLVTQKLFGTSLITTYKLSEYTDALASQNAIKRDADGGDFSLEFCKNLCRQVLGPLYKEN